MSNSSNFTIAETFEIKSGKIVISDPCYEITGEYTKEGYGPSESNYSGVPALNGTWNTHVEYTSGASWGGPRVEMIICNHSLESFASSWQKLPYNIGVDSGQAGVFDAAIYPPDPADGQIGFYAAACEQTLSDAQYGIVLGAGVATSSGYGDGAYDVYVIYKDNLVIAVKIVFIENHLEDVVEYDDDEDLNFRRDLDDEEFEDFEEN